MGLINYFKETKSEMKHVSWPTRKQATAYTILVILISIAVAVYTGVLDFIFVDIIKKFFIS